MRGFELLYPNKQHTAALPRRLTGTGPEGSNHCLNAFAKHLFMLYLWNAACSLSDLRVTDIICWYIDAAHPFSSCLSSPLGFTAKPGPCFYCRSLLSKEGASENMTVKEIRAKIREATTVWK
jgi:hypothetical protein